MGDPAEKGRGAGRAPPAQPQPCLLPAQLCQVQGGFRSVAAGSGRRGKETPWIWVPFVELPFQVPSSLASPLLSSRPFSSLGEGRKTGFWNATPCIRTPSLTLSLALWSGLESFLPPSLFFPHRDHSPWVAVRPERENTRTVCLAQSQYMWAIGIFIIGHSPTLLGGWQGHRESRPGVPPESPIH